MVIEGEKGSPRLKGLTMIELNAPLEHTVTVIYFDSRKIAEDGNISPAIVTSTVSKPDKSSAWKLIKDCEAKATCTLHIALIQISVSIGGSEVYCHDYS